MTESINLPSVPVPASRRLQLAIKKWLPIAFFGMACIACMLLWRVQQRSVTLLGEIEVIELTISSAENGIVSAIVPGRPTSEFTFTNVAKNQLVAVLDDRFLKERLNEATLQLDAFASDILTVAELKPVESSVVKLRKESELQSAIMQVRQLDSADTQRRQELSFEIEKIRAEIGFEKATPLAGATAAEPVKLQIAKQKIRSLRSELAAISISVARLDSRSPVDGRITKIHVNAGDAVVVGQPLLTLTTTQGSHVTAYARENSNVAPFAGMPVTIRTRTDPVKEFKTHVESVGPAIGSIPSRQRAFAKIEEWGRPIRVRIPPSVELVPGSLVEILFESSALAQ